ncbi:hypothetical protein HZC31_04040 [Candidatus Woesearchaeota archaeon]|nr:hypothetical protein [Candidatus Woesearchaeota archaeon]
MQKTVASLQTLDFSKCSEKELLAHLQTLIEQGAEQWCPLIFIDSFDAEGNQFLEAEIKKHTPQLLSELGTLTTPSAMSYSQREKLAFLKLALLALKEKNIILKAKKAKELSSSLQKLLHAHEQQFYWSKNNYAHIFYLDAQFFLKELQKLLSSSSEKQITDEIRRIETSSTTQLKKRDHLLSIAPVSVQSICYFFQKLTVLRDIRKEKQCILVMWVKLLSQALAKKMNCDPVLLERMVYSEIPRLSTDRKQFLKELQERTEVVYVMSDLHDTVLFTNQEAAQLHTFLESKISPSSGLKGMVASSGKAVGIVRVINKVSEFGSFQKGDILVSAMTRPEFLPIMGKAAAIVTDEGGITSHAAIVSRELGIPCIIGTQTATRVLKTGQKVEVDAVHGIVTILH